MLSHLRVNKGMITLTNGPTCCGIFHHHRCRRWCQRQRYVCTYRSSPDPNSNLQSGHQVRISMVVLHQIDIYLFIHMTFLSDKVKCSWATCVSVSVFIFWGCWSNNLQLWFLLPQQKQTKLPFLFTNLSATVRDHIYLLTCCGGLVDC